MKTTRALELIEAAIEAVQSRSLAKIGMPQCQRGPIYRDFRKGKLRLQALTMVVGRIDRTNYRDLFDRRLDRPEFKRSVIDAALESGLAVRVCIKEESYCAEYEVRINAKA